MSRSNRAEALTTDLVIANRYRLERLLGQGGMGSVHVAVDMANGRRVALKLLRAGASPTVAALFEREYQTLAGLRHPGIVQVFEYGGHEASAYYTMELVEGSDLDRSAPMPWREACACLRDTASILGVLHARGLLHRDLSPRNLLRTADGRLKLIDFGALTSFGIASDVVGTPPFVPPEAVRGTALDQRSDLFALGALGYYLITGTHAYPARHLTDLVRLHQTPPAAPSSLLALLSKPGDVPVPTEVDALLLALLRFDLEARPASTAELIDRLHALTELAPELDELSAQGYLDSKAFVGREDERARVLAALEEAREGHVRGVLLEAAPGLGRTRLLQELAVDARLGGALVVSVGAPRDARPFGVAEQLALALLEALPNETRTPEHRHALSLVSSTLAAKLALPGATVAETRLGEQRVRSQLALRDWIGSLAGTRLLALLVDDVHACDEESCALLATLARLDGKTKLLLVLSADSGVRAPSPALLSLRGATTRLTLPPLTAAETLSLLRSVFGSVDFLERTAERLFRASGGRPDYCLELAQHLIRERLARYVDGMWSLPSELDERSLPHSHEDAQLARLAQLSAAARRLARTLSIPHHGGLTGALCARLAQLPESTTLTLLSELTQAGVVSETADGFALVHEAIKLTLHKELSPEERAAAHQKLGRARLATAGTDRVLLLRASLHLLRGGEHKRALRLMRQAGYRQTYATLHQTARLFEEAYLLLRAQGCDAHARASALSTLSLASYHVDRRYARYADDALQSFEQVLRLDLARRLATHVRPKLALIIALLVAAFGIVRRRSYSPSLKEMVSLCMRAMVALTGTFSCSIDPRSARRFAALLSPFEALGEDHGACMASRLATLFAQGTEDRPARSTRQLGEFIAYIERDLPLREVTAENRVEALAGCLYVYGVSCAWRDDDEALRVADRLDTFSPLYAMSADHLRQNYYAAQGNVERAEHFRKRLELHAVQIGNTWQVETWSPADAIKTALRTNDALLARRAADALARMTLEVPSLEREERHARGTYHMLRGKYDKAIALFDRDEEPQAVVGWARTRGSLARCFNALGQHARARDICLDVLGRLTPEDLRFAVMNLNVQVELALAHAGLGEHALAASQLDALLALHMPGQGALTLGALHEARCRVALRMGDLSGAREHLDEARSWLAPTGIASLRDLLDALTRAVQSAERPDDGSTLPAALEASQQLHSRVQLLLTTQGGQSGEERARKSLQLAVELSGARAGFLVFTDDTRRVVCHRGADSPGALVTWAQGLLDAAGHEEQTELSEAMSSSLGDVHTMTVERVSYVFLPLWESSAHGLPIAGLVLGFEGLVRHVPDALVLRALARHLREDPIAALV